MKTTAKYSLSKINYYLIFTFLGMFLMFPAKVYACACCANVGTWSETSQKISDYEFNEINRLQFSPTAKVNQTQRDENVGISSNSANYTFSVVKNQRRWNLQFKDEQGKTGILTLTIPRNAVSFKTDLYDNSQGGGSGALLYQELRLEGKLSGNGIFTKGITPDTKFRLVLQGRGNNCTSAENFKTWNLQVFGSRADYSFRGSFKP
ncbi:hypothetical protein [Cylindrospermum sp. FACHB-282]|uniref:hypothetical protein n=1 Tax=Cylindrospermum sp. FACHB-282 TaxID=2692794 RepID=UPI001F54D372|nr:hypothetical protein [Cylindrospermum sp. FACHB-282]